MKKTALALITLLALTALAGCGDGTNTSSDASLPSDDKSSIGAGRTAAAPLAAETPEESPAGNPAPVDLTTLPTDSSSDVSGYPGSPDFVGPPAPPQPFSGGSVPSDPEPSL